MSWFTESSRNSNWVIVVLMSLLAVINWNFNSLEIFPGVRCKIGFSFVLSQNCPNAVHAIIHLVLIKKPVAGMQSLCWPKVQGEFPLQSYGLPAHLLILYSPPCQGQGLCHNRSFPMIFPSSHSAPRGLSLSTFPLSSLCSLGPKRLLFALPQATESPQLRSPQPLTQLASHIGAKEG